MENPITKGGYERLQSELSACEAEVQAAIREVRDAGKEVHVEKLGQKLQRFNQLKSALENADIIDPAQIPRNGRCVFGTFVDLEREGGGKMSCQIVGAVEADLEAGRLSSASPLGKALLGKKKGDAVYVETPDGELEYTLLAVRYSEKEPIPAQTTATAAVEKPQPQPAPVSPPAPVAPAAEDAAEKPAKLKAEIVAETPAPPAPTPPTPQVKAGFWSAAFSWVKKLFK